MSYQDPGGPTYPASSIQSFGAMRTRTLTARALTGNVQLSSMAGELVGWCMRETTGAAGAVVELYDGNDATGQLVGTQGLGNGTSGNYSAPLPGVEITVGLFAHVVTGTADVIAYYRADIPGD